MHQIQSVGAQSLTAFRHPESSFISKTHRSFQGSERRNPIYGQLHLLSMRLLQSTLPRADHALPESLQKTIINSL